MQNIVIIGAGECGIRAAFALREAGFDGAVTLLGAEAALPYERPPLSKEIGAAPKAIRAEETFAEKGIDLRRGSPVSSIDTSANQVQLAGGEVLSYDALLLATGAKARLFPGMEGCKTLRTDTEAAEILSHLKPGASVGIIGGGFIGLELAATARKAGADVTVFEAGPRLLGRAVPEAVAQVVHDRHEAEGVKALTGANVASASASQITLADGQVLEFDIVVAGVGALPVTDLAEAAGLTVKNGIVVDDSFRSSVPNVFAAGDCCNFPWQGGRLRLESWKAAQDQGAHAAAAILGACDPYAKVPWFWSDQYDMTLQVAGLFDADRPVQSRDAGDDKCIVFQCDADSRLSAVAGIGPGNSVAKDLRLLEKLIEKGVTVDPAEVADPAVNLKRLLKAR